ncbi:MAG: hypothetical protein KME56_09220 [Candidatus Thiodiazotropha sp. (ex Ctena orbiculata)]|nr:hypothetical protein [Candidatus Thiodiazotropha taylori]PUB87454.1 MAG: hypothetical protein DBP00_08870 [gamma proteobacterium symbiont of Ctena orbiculata]MBT2996801.1 hypothetical protein [Candidatus Thiodiazotropha taylori]MBT3002034.1 hypothetical protein [Candidatus Thiodiazotropha taylori]MBV2106235.1 hypothetical protein [Candidatus Thiodiazotropha taylori]
MNLSASQIDANNNDRDKNLTMAVYALQAISFLFVVTFLVAVIINYVKRDDVRGSWLESHFRWQIRTFWFSLLWMSIGFVTSFILVGYLLLFANAIWLIYRIIKGWLRLSEGREMYSLSNG